MASTSSRVPGQPPYSRTASVRGRDPGLPDPAARWHRSRAPRPALVPEVGPPPLGPVRAPRPAATPSLPESGPQAWGPTSPLAPRRGPRAELARMERDPAKPDRGAPAETALEGKGEIRRVAAAPVGLWQVSCSPPSPGHRLRLPARWAPGRDPDHCRRRVVGGHSLRGWGHKIQPPRLGREVELYCPADLQPHPRPPPPLPRGWAVLIPGVPPRRHPLHLNGLQAPSASLSPPR